MKSINIKYNRKYVKIFLILVIVLYPLINSFLGIELGDTGIHLYNYVNIMRSPEKVGFTCYFTNFIAKAWLKVFGFLGLWGLNFLEVIIEWIMALVVYRTFRKKLGENTTLLGIAIAILCTGTYLNVFNYHQFNVFLLVLMFCAQYKAMEKNKLYFSVIAGVFYAIDFFARVGGIIAFISCVTYVFWTIMEEKKWKDFFKHIGSYFAGFGISSACFCVLLKVTGQLSYFVNNIFRLEGLASDSESNYSMGNLFDKLVFDSLDTIASGFIFFAAFWVLVVSISIIQRKQKKGKRLVDIVLGLIGSFVSLYMLFYAYDVNPAESWPQMTTGPRFVWGVFLTLAFIGFVAEYMKKNYDKCNIILMGCLLVVLGIAGSNTGTKHVNIGLWILAPAVCYIVRKLYGYLMQSRFVENVGEILFKEKLTLTKISVKITAITLIAVFSFKYVHMIIYTCNFDDVNRFNLTSTVKSDKLRGLLTTEREAEAVQGVLDEVEKVESNAPLMVFGNSILFYYLCDRESYMKPWVTSYVDSMESFYEQVEIASQKPAPVIIYCKTNCYEGFRLEDYEESIQEEKAKTYDGKKEWFLYFIQSGNYQILLDNEYYCVMYPSSKYVDFSYIDEIMR